MHYSGLSRAIRGELRDIQKGVDELRDSLKGMQLATSYIRLTLFVRSRK